MKQYIRVGAAMGAVAATLALPAAAMAAGMTVTGDDGSPVTLTEGTAAQIRYMTPKMMPTFSGSEGRFSLGVTDPAGQDAGASVSCESVTAPPAPSRIDYGGNGTYTVTLTTYADDSDASCLQPTTTQTFTFKIAAATAVHPPSSTLMRRKPGVSREIEHHFTLDKNPGALSYDINWAINPAFLPDGGIDSDKTHFAAETFDAPGAAGDLDFATPGIYTFVASARAGLLGSPWSAPVKVTVMGPFDFNGALSIRPAGKSKYEMDGTVGDGRSAVGQRVAVSIAKGNGAFKPLLSAKIDSDGNIDFTFKQKGNGRYRVRLAYRGSTLVAKGAWIEKVALSSRPSASPKLIKG